MSAQPIPVVFLILCACVAAEAKTAEKMECRDVPAPVRTAAAKEKAKWGTEASCEKITDNGAVFYEVKITAESGKMREIVFRPDGQVAEFEEESQLAGIPSAARAAIEKAVASGELLKVDVIHRGRALLYEGEYRQAGTKKKVIVDGAGNLSK